MAQKDPRNRAKSGFPGKPQKVAWVSYQPAKALQAPRELEPQARTANAARQRSFQEIVQVGSKRHGGAVLELVARGLIERRNVRLLDRADFPVASVAVAPNGFM